MNNNNKQFQNIKLLKNKNKQLLLENETLHQQLEELEEEVQELMIEEEQIQQNEINNQEYLHPASPVRGSINAMRPHTPQTPTGPTHGYAKTLVMGNRDSLEVGSTKDSLHNSEHDSKGW